MTQHSFPPTQLDADDFEFDGTQVAKISADVHQPGAIEWYAMERGSDAHIAFLEQIVKQMQTTLAELKAQRVAVRDSHGHVQPPRPRS